MATCSSSEPRAPSKRGSSCQAQLCRTGFLRDFWMPERRCHAVALDGDKHQVNSLTSNIGHLLWSGLLDEREAAATAERLLDGELCSGWGVRTLGAAEAGYNPLGYHFCWTCNPGSQEAIASCRASATSSCDREEQRDDTDGNR